MRRPREAKGFTRWFVNIQQQNGLQRRENATSPLDFGDEFADRRPNISPDISLMRELPTSP
jgi:hypothetical protein